MAAKRKQRSKLQEEYFNIYYLVKSKMRLFNVIFFNKRNSNKNACCYKE